MNPKLYFVATPIGNLKEISNRAIETLNSVDFIACENPVNSLVLLKSLGINKKLVQLNSVDEENVSNNVINLILSGSTCAYMSDAGYPCISDPGAILVKKAIENNIEFNVINGSSAMLTALVGSGLDTSRFTFIGFLSNKPGTLKNQLEEYKNHKETLIFYESSHRIQDTLKSMYEVFGNRNVVVARELTKLYEEYIRGDLKSMQNLDKNQQKGEFVIILEGSKEEAKELNYYLQDVKELIDLGLKLKSAVNYVASKNNISKNELYNLYLKENKD